jgi:hypothetical protein
VPGAAGAPEREPMKFSHFSHIWAKPGMTPHARYEQLWRELAIVQLHLSLPLVLDYNFDC